MNWKLLVLGVVGVVCLLVLAVLVGGWLFITDDSRLLYYDSQPATVEESAVTQAGYTTVNTTEFNVSYRPVPVVARNVSLRVWASVYVGGVTTDGRPAQNLSEGGNVSVDVANTSAVTVFSMSSLELGPVAFNPLVYASDPGILNRSGLLIDQGETYLPRNVTNVTDLSVQSDRPVEMLGQETEMTTLSGTLRPTPESDPVNVTVYLARVTHEGDLVLAMGVAPVSGDTAGEFETLVEGVRHPDASARRSTGGQTPAVG